MQLSYLLERRGGWGAEENWEDVLSLGEQQRLGMARLLFHAPRFGVLDQVCVHREEEVCLLWWNQSQYLGLLQCTDAVSVDVEEHLYRLAERQGITIVTISQRAALIKHHRQELRLLGTHGSWQLYRR